LQDGLVSERKRELARMYINEHISQVGGAREKLLNSGNAPLPMHSSIITFL
jgi:hypothetical protein